MVSVGAVAVDAWASGAAVLARFCDAATLQDFDVIRDLSFGSLQWPEQPGSERCSLYRHGFTRGATPREDGSRNLDRQRIGRRMA